MRNKKTMAILLGLLAGAGSVAFADTVTLDISQDATIFEPNVDQGTWTDMRIRWQSDDAWGRNHPVAQFDLSGITSGLGAGESITVNYARFAFWAFTSDDSGPGWDDGANDFPELAMYYNTSSWSDSGGAMPTFDNTVSVNTDSLLPDGVTPDKFTAPDTIAADAAGWLFFDDGLAGALVEGWVNGGIVNNGVQIQGTGAYTDTSRYLHLSSSEGGVAPYLYVDYDIVPEPATFGLLGAFGAAILVVRRKFMI